MEYEFLTDENYCCWGRKSDCIEREKLFCRVLSMGFDGRKLWLGESRVHPPCRCGPRNCNFPLRVRKFLASRRKQRGINRGGSARFRNRNKRRRERKKKRSPAWQRESRLEITIFISIKGSGARSYTVLSVSEGNLLSRCPENYPAFAPRTLSLRTARLQ